MLIFLIIILSWVFLTNGFMEGVPTSIKDQPYAISVFENDELWLTGCILSPSFVLFDIYFYDRYAFKIRAGSNLSHSEGRKVAALLGLYRFPDAELYQLIILQLWHPLRISDTIRPLRLPKIDSIDREAKFNFTGFGPTKEIPRPGTLNSVSKHLAPDENCPSEYFNKEYMICVDLASSEGDLGGPMVFDGTLYGVFAMMMRNNSTFAIFARLDNKLALDWIRNIITNPIPPPTLPPDQRDDDIRDHAPCIFLKNQILFAVFSLVICSI